MMQVNKTSKYNVRFTCIRVTIVAVEEQVLRILSVCL
jgi:hypothetical protein